MSQENKQKKQELVTVKLLVDSHNHAGNPCEIGDVIHLLKAQADVLIKSNKAEAAKGDASEKAE